MPPAAGLGGARPPGTASKPANGNGPTPGPSKPNPKLVRDSAAVADDDDDDDQETTDDDTSDEEAAFEMDGQELWTQTYCVTCDCLIEPGEGIAKPGSSTATGTSPVTHSTLKSRSGTIKARGSSASETADEAKAAAASKHSPTNTTKTPGPAPLKRTHSAGRLHAKPGAGPLGPHKRTGSAGSRLHALSELRPTTKLHDDKAKSKASTREPSAPHGRKSPAASRPSSAASNRSHSNSSGPSSFKSNQATHASNANNTTTTTKRRGFLGGLGLTPAALKQQQDELAAKRKAPTPLYCSERCRLIDERRSSGLGELTQYLSQPLVPPTNTAWAPPPPPPSHSWARSASVSSVPVQMAASTPESECLCPECMDKYADGSSASGAGIPSGASDTATESSSGYVYGRGAAQKPRTASGRLVTPLGLDPPGANTEGYFPQYAPSYAMTPAAQNSPRVRAAEVAQQSEPARYSSVPPRTPSAASAGKASTAGTEGSVLSSGSGSSLWEPRLKPRSNSGVRSSNGFSADANGNAHGTTSGLSTSTATPAITPRQSMVVPSSSSSHNIRAARRLSVPGFAPTHEVDEETQQQSEAGRAISPASTLPHRPSSRSNRSSLLLATSPLNLLDKSSQHHAAPSIDLFSDHVGSPSARGSLLSRSLASEHTLMGASGITLTNQHTLATSSSVHDRAHLDSEQLQRQTSQDADLPGRRPSAMSQSLSYQSFQDPSKLDHSSRNADSSDSLSMAVGSLKLAQSRASGPLAAMSRRGTDTSESRPTDLRRLSLFGVAGAPARRNSNAVSISSSNPGSTSSGWLRSLSSAWLNWRSSASTAPMQTDSDVFHSTGDSDERPSRVPDHPSRRESSASRSSSSSSSSSSSQKISYAQKRASSLRDVSMARSSSRKSDKLHPIDDRGAAVTPTQSLVAKPTIRRGHVPAYVSEIGQGGIPGDSLPADAKAEAGAATAIADPAQRLARARVDSFTRVTDADAAHKKASKRRSRDITVLPPLLAPISRSGSSTNLYAQMPRSARAYSAGRAWSAANTPQMYVGSAGSSHQQQLVSAGGYGQPPLSPTLMRSPYHSSLALTQDAARAALSPSRPNSAAGYHSLQYSAGTSPRAKGLGWGAMTSIASPPASSSTSCAFPHHSGHRQSISYGHAAAVASRAVVNQAARVHHHPNHHQHQHHAHQHHHRHQHSWHDQSSAASDQQGNERERVAVGHMMNLGAPPNSTGQAASGRHSTMPAMLHRSPTPSVPEDGGEMSSHDLTSGDFVTRPNSAMAGQGGRRHHRTSLMPPPRSRSSLGMHPAQTHHRAVQPLTSTDALPALTPASEDVDAEGGVQYVHREQQREPPRTWSYDHLSGLKTYPILQLPDRETHDVYDPAWGLDAGGLAKHLGQDARLPRSSATNGSSGGQQGGNGPPAAGAENGNGNGTVQMGFQPHRKKLFYFDA